MSLPADLRLSLLVAGCERSGSTWLANLFESHPRVGLLMEPFAPYAELFPGFPVRQEALGAGPPEHPLSLPPLIRAKYPRWLSWNLAGQERRQREALWRKTWKRLPLNGLQRRFLQYHLLNLHQMSLPDACLPVKVSPPDHWVMKEFRINHSLGWLRRQAPEAKLLVLVRHPVSQVRSMVRMMDQGSLGELRESLPNFMKTTEREGLIPGEVLGAADSLEERLLLYWWINYSNLMKQAKEQDWDFRLLAYEVLQAHPDHELKQLFHWLNLDVDPAVEKFLNWSTAADSDSQDPIGMRRKAGNIQAPKASETLDRWMEVLHAHRPLPRELMALWPGLFAAGNSPETHGA